MIVNGSHPEMADLVVEQQFGISDVVNSSNKLELHCRLSHADTFQQHEHSSASKRSGSILTTPEPAWATKAERTQLQSEVSKVSK